MTTTTTEIHEAKFRYEMQFDPTGASFERFGRGIIKYKIQVLDTYLQGEMGRGRGTVVVMIKATIHNAGAFSQFMLLEGKGGLLYRSPTYFDNGAIRPIYRSAEDEFARIPISRGPKIDAMLDRMEKEHLGKDVEAAIAETSDRLRP